MSWQEPRRPKKPFTHVDGRYLPQVQAGRVFAAHLDDKRSQKAHAWWYRFHSSPGVLWFTFSSVDQVPQRCHCGNAFYLPAKQPKATEARV